MTTLRTVVTALLLSFLIPDDSRADKLVAPGGPTFKSVDPPTINSFGAELAAFNGSVYFAANDNVNGNELWRTDGTTTTLVSNLNPNASGAGSNPHSFTIVGTRMFFNANPGDATSGVFYIDAAAPTTVKTAKALTAPNGGGAGTAVTANATLVGAVNGKAVLSRLQGENANANYAVYVLGDTGDTFTKISNGLDSIGATNVFSPTAVAGGFMYYARNNSNTSPGQGAELWRTDGSTVEQVADIYPNPPGSFPGSNPGAFVATSDRVYFTADDGTHGRELWVTNPADKNDTHLVHEHHAGLTGTSIEDPGAVGNGNVLYYTPNDPTTGGEVWRTDGTDAGTRVVKDITPGTGATAGPDPFAFKSGIGMLRGSDVYASDGTDAGTSLLASLDNDGYGPNSATVLGDRAYFVGAASPFGQAVWRTDGTFLGTHPLTAGGFDGTSATSGCTCAQSLVTLGSKVLFFGRDPGTNDSGEVKLYVIDTTLPDDQRVATTLPTLTPALGGTRLDASTGTWSRSVSQYTYTWLRNGQPIDGAPAYAYYFLTAADAGQKVSVRVTTTGIGAPRFASAESLPYAGGGASPTPTVTPSATPTKTLTVKRKPKLKGKAKVGAKLKLTPPKLAQAGVKLSFRWYANGKRIKKQAKSSLKLTRKQKGKRISAKILARKAGYKTLTFKVGPTRKVKRR